MSSTDYPKHYVQFDEWWRLRTWRPTLASSAAFSWQAGSWRLARRLLVLRVKFARPFLQLQSSEISSPNIGNIIDEEKYSAQELAVYPGQTLNQQDEQRNSPLHHPQWGLEASNAHCSLLQLLNLLDDIFISWPYDPHRRQLSSTAMHSLHRSSPRLISDNLIVTWQWSTACADSKDVSDISLPGIPRSMLFSRLSIRAATTSQALFTSLFSCHTDGKNNGQLDQVGAKNPRFKIGLRVYRLQSTESHPFRKTNDHFQFTPNSSHHIQDFNA